MRPSTILTAKDCESEKGYVIAKPVYSTANTATAVSQIWRCEVKFDFGCFRSAYISFAGSMIEEIDVSLIKTGLWVLAPR